MRIHFFAAGLLLLATGITTKGLSVLDPHLGALSRDVALGSSLLALASLAVRSTRSRLKLSSLESETARLRLSDEFNRSILQSSRDSIQMLDLDGRVISINDSGVSLMCFPEREAALGKSWPAYWGETARTAVLQAILAARGGATSQFEECCATLQGDIRWWNVVVSPIRDSSSKVARLLAISRDITERKESEQQIKHSELRYRELFENNPLPAWIFDTATLRFLDVNQTAIDRYGYSFATFAGMRVSDLHSLDEHRQTESTFSNEAYDGERSGPWLHRLCDGSQITVELTMHRIDWFKVPACLVMVHDVTERLASEKKFRSLFERSGDAILLSADDVIVDCNPAAVYLLAASSKEHILARRAVDLMASTQPDGQSAESLLEELHHQSALGGVVRKDCLARKLSSEEFFADLSITSVEISGKPMTLTILHDLTTRLKTDERLRQSEAALREAQEIARLGKWEVNLQTSTVTWSDESYRIFGVDPTGEPLSIGEFTERIHPEDRARIIGLTLDTLALDKKVDVEYRYIRPSGETRYIHSRAHRHLDHAGKPLRFSGTAIDVTEQRLIHEALRVSEARFHTFMENSPALAFVKDHDGRMLYMNRACKQMWDLEHSDWQGKTDVELWSAEAAAEFRRTDRNVLEKQTSISLFEVLPTPGGGTCKLLTYKFPIQFDGGEPLIGGVSIDISGQEGAERELLQTLADKEALLKEVHHRVKNNLQVICSLLGMQAAALEDPTTVAALRDSQERVQSMAMIHELLYTSKTLADVDFAEYSERLLRELSTSYGLDLARVQLTVDIAPIRLGVDRAIPCGLILNELISNALKYAFPPVSEGEIRISLVPCDAQHLRLTVADNGIGLPEGFAIDNTRSLGLRIVQILTRQLDGSLTVTSGAGSSFEIRFPAEHPLLQSV